MAAGNLYPSPNEISACVEARRSTLTEKLHEERHRLHSRIEEIDQVLAALNRLRALGYAEAAEEAEQSAIHDERQLGRVLDKE